MSSVSPRRRPVSLALTALLAVGMLLSGGLASVALAQDDAVTAEGTPTPAEPAVADEELPVVDSERGTASVGGISATAGGPAMTEEQTTAPEEPSPVAQNVEPQPVTVSQAAETPEAAGEAGSGRTEPSAAGSGIAQPASAGNGSAGRDNADSHDAGGGQVGTGGGGEASGAGGTIIQSALISGNNRGTEVNVEDCAYGSVQIDGGTVVNATDISLSANGGTAVSTANGGDDGVVQAAGAIASRRISAGNGGSADSAANGGTIVTGPMITGNNRGHEVNFADCPGGRGDAVLIIDTGDISNTTSIDISADGGTALSDAGGGYGNLVTGGLRGGGAGNGGSADSAANGGTVITGAMITGNNRGNSITVGRPLGDGTTTGATGSGACGSGPVTMMIDGGDISNSTILEISADGGTAISDAGGGSGNTGVGGGAVGNGGSADASANGGTIITNAMITGNNRGNTISVGNVSGCGPSTPASTDAPGPDLGPARYATSAPVGAPALVAPIAGPKPVASGATRSAGVVVLALPNTGTGPADRTPSPVVLPATMLLALVGGSYLLVRGRGWRLGSIAK